MRVIATSVVVWFVSVLACVGLHRAPRVMVRLRLRLRLRVRVNGNAVGLTSILDRGQFVF